MNKPLSEKKTPKHNCKSISHWSVVKWQGPGSAFLAQPAQTVTSDTPIPTFSTAQRRNIHPAPENLAWSFSILHYSIIKLGTFCVHLKRHQLPLGQKQFISFLLTYFNLGVNSMMWQRQQLAFELSRQKAGQTPALSHRKNCINLQGTFHYGPNATFHWLHPNYICSFSLPEVAYKVNHAYGLTTYEEKAIIIQVNGQIRMKKDRIKNIYFS